MAGGEPAGEEEAFDDALLQRSGVKNAKITPMLRQWLHAKRKAKDAVLLFRMGDFYELFAQDAVTASPVLDLALTTRDRDKGEGAMPMAGFPHHQAPQYIAKLIEKGFKVAVCDQMEDPALARGIVKRDVTRIVTPGMVLEDESLDARANNWLVAIVKRGAWGLAALDLSTGEHKATSVASAAALLDEIARLDPREVVVEEADELSLEPARRVERRPSPQASRPLTDSLGAVDRALQDFERKSALVAVELLLGYVHETQGRLPRHLKAPQPYVVDAQLLLDATTRAHLDLCGPPGDLRRPGTLLALVDRTSTAPGGRRLLRWLQAPSTDAALIEARLDRTAAFVADPGTRAAARRALSGVLDVERIVARVGTGRAAPRELGRMRDSLQRLPALRAALINAGGPLADTGARLDTLEDLAAVLAGALVDAPPTTLGDDPVFRAGHDAALDAVTSSTTGGRGRIAALEERERKDTGIPSLKIKYNRVFGYTIELTKAHTVKAPKRFLRKQTIANGERYVTDELLALEAEVEGAEQKRAAREAELFVALCAQVVAASARVLAAADVLADVDALVSLAEVADEHRWTRPMLAPKEARALRLVDVRHPIVEDSLARKGEPYVPSTVVLDGSARQLLLVTGPNMAGKSTLMRAVALAQVLAQAGSFVPASQASLSLCDRVFTRVGASDDLAGGRSTFMVEMTEAAHILAHATADSLVLLDEIGRGTSTFDGVSIAWAVAEHLHDVVRARTLFATHYHELVRLQERLPRLVPVHVVVKEWNDEVVFTRVLADGGAGRSYGIHVARLAGLPPTVVQRAKDVLASLERTAPAIAAATVDPLRARLAALDADGLSPRAALQLVQELVEEARRQT